MWCSRGTARSGHSLGGYNCNLLSRCNNSLTIGANDCILPTTGASQHLPLEKFKHNLADIIRNVQQTWPSAEILLITVTPSIPERWLTQLMHEWVLSGSEAIPPQLDRTIGVTERYADACIEVARSSGVHVVDAWTALIEKAGGTDARLLAEYLP
jgi:lysophospholipase L1-like esterase